MRLLPREDKFFDFFLQQVNFLCQASALLVEGDDASPLEGDGTETRHVVDLAQRMLDNDVKPEIEIFDLAMLYNAANLVQQGLLKSPVHVQFVLGIPNSLPADREVLEFEIAQLKRVLPDATWTAAGVGRFQLVVNEWTLELGGHCRTGLSMWSKWRSRASRWALQSRRNCDSHSSTSRSGSGLTR